LLPTRLLLVDDEPSFLLALSEALKRQLNETVIDTVLSTEGALLLLREHNYHAIVSDVRMVGMDGLALLNQIRERWPNTPVVLMTGAGTDREAEALSSGAFAFIEKPVDVNRLSRILSVAMEKSLFRQRIAEANRQSLARVEQQTRRMSAPLSSPKKKSEDIS
jgi:two-component system, sensor histidine kinase and response regulator